MGTEIVYSEYGVLDEKIWRIRNNHFWIRAVGMGIAEGGVVGLTGVLVSWEAAVYLGVASLIADAIDVGSSGWALAYLKRKQKTASWASGSGKTK